MLTEASKLALENLRDPSHLEWYVVSLLAITIYIYAGEVERKNWSLVFAGLAFWGMDWINELVNSLILHFTGTSALWTTPGSSAYVIAASAVAGKIVAYRQGMFEKVMTNQN